MMNRKIEQTEFSKYVVSEESYLEEYTTTVCHIRDKAGVFRVRVCEDLLPGPATSVLMSEYVIALSYCISLFINDK